MRILRTTAAWLALSLPLAACTTQLAQIQSSGAMGKPDAQFVDTAYSVAQLDDAEGKLAMTKATDPRVADIAARLKSEADVMYPNLKSALIAEGQKPPSAVPPDLSAKVQKLSSLSGPAFDRQFVADQLAAHKQAVQILGAEDTATKNGAMRGQVETVLPAVQGNLATLQYLSDDLSPKQG